MPGLHQQLDIKRCPHCGIDKPNMPMHWHTNTKTHSGGKHRFWRVYMCVNCGGLVTAASPQDGGEVTEMYPSGVKETFDFARLPKPVAEDFQEALDCYSICRFNAFAAMCRRTVQSIFIDLGTKGKDRVHKQLKEAKDMADIDDETYQILDLIIIQGHDGAHPNLPRLSPERARVLLELMKDILYQLYVRRKKIQEAIDLRTEAIEQTKKTTEDKVQ